MLLVDDEIDLVSALKLALRRQPFEILTATSPLQALELFETTRFDAIVADDRMPLMSGSELLTRVQRSSPMTIRILLTGYPTLDATSRAINDGHAFGFLTKPCDSRALAAMLLQALALRA